MQSIIYDYLVSDFTKIYLKSALNSIEKDSTVLYIGIGTGTSLINNQNIIINKNLKIIGIDNNQNYLNKCINNINTYYLDDYISVYLQNIYDWKSNQKFDYILFSDSYTIIPNMIKHCYQYLSEKGKIIIFSALFDKITLYKSFIKRNIKYLIGIDFGEMMSKTDLIEFVSSEAKECTIEKISSHYIFLFGQSNIYLTIYTPNSFLYS